MKRHDKPELRENRKGLRQTLTAEEAFLWKHLQQKKLDGKKFRRQHSIDNFIVDFYCATERLIIELDGEVHNNPIAEKYDRKRDAYLTSLGYQVIRFENRMVFEHLSSVLEEIKANFKD